MKNKLKQLDVLYNKVVVNRSMSSKSTFTKSLLHTSLASVIITGVISLTACQSTGAQPIQASNYSGSEGNKNRDKKTPKEIAHIRTTLAGQYIRNNQLDAATRQLDLAFEAYRRYAPAYDMMGVLLQQEGSKSNLKKAEKYFKKAISIDKDFTQANNNYGVYLSLMKRYKEAAVQFEIAGEKLGYEGRIGALENLGRNYLKLNNDKEATKAFTRALEGNPNSLVSRIELVDLLIKANRSQQARRLFEDVKALLGNRPLSPRLMLQGVKISKSMGNTAEQQRYSEELLSSYPLSGEAKTLKNWLRNPNKKWK